MAPGLGIEPRLTESKSIVLPLHNPGINLVVPERIELSFMPCHGIVLPLN